MTSLTSSYCIILHSPLVHGCAACDSMPAIVAAELVIRVSITSYASNVPVTAAVW